MGVSDTLAPVSVSLQLDPVQAAARTLRDATRDKSYRAYEMGQEAGSYLRWKRGRLTENSYRTYESTLDKLARHFPDLRMADFEPPVGTERLEEWMDERWGNLSPNTYNLHLCVLSDFFKWAVIKGKLHGDPTLPMQTHKKRDIERVTFAEDETDAILAGGPDPEHVHRDRCALRLLLRYGVRKGALMNAQYKHFDHARKTLTIFTKGGKVRRLPIVESAFWDDLGRAILDERAEPDHFFVPQSRMLFRGYDRTTGDAIMVRLPYPDRKIGDSGMHHWWYRCLGRAGVVAPGTTRGRKMHGARHTAGQRVLDKTGNLKAAQMLLGHASIKTTADIYTDWDIEQLAETMREVTSE